jgi:hypothetical protein
MLTFSPEQIVHEREVHPRAESSYCLVAKGTRILAAQKDSHPTVEKERILPPQSSIASEGIAVGC